jgi:iron complex transport system substrate-binding protein
MCPSRIISLVPCITYTLNALKAQDRVVGKTRYCPAGPGTIVGGIHDLDRDLIKDLQPDLILVDPEENGPDNIRYLDKFFPLRSVSVTSVEESLSFYHETATMLGSVGTSTPAAFPQIDKARQQSVVTLIWKDPYMAVGRQTYASSLLARFGWSTPVTQPGYGELTIPELLELQPALVLLPDEPYPFTNEDAGELQSMLAQAGTRVRTIDGRALFWYGAYMLESAGPILSSV